MISLLKERRKEKGKCMRSTSVFHRKKILWSPIIVMLVLSVTMVNVGWASPDTHFYLDPALVGPGDLTLYGSTWYLPMIQIRVADAPNSYAWEFSLSWDPDLLDLVYMAEGTFLERGMYATQFVSSPPTLAEANLDGEITIGCTLVGEVPWASGNGLLCNLGFAVDAGAEGSTILDLFNTKLFDHLVAGSPAPTPYPNEDCFFYNVETHDIGITDVTAPSIVQIGYPASVSVTVVNEGTATETFDITLYNETTVIDSITVTDLPGFGSFATETFLLSTAAPCVYNLVAYADIVAGEVDTDDNTLIDGTVTVVPPDIAVLSVEPLIPELHGLKGPFYGYLPPPYPPGIGLTLTLVTVKNEGPGYSGYFDLIVLANGVPVSSYYATNNAYLNLPPGMQLTIPLPWIIYGSAPATYFLTGYATPVTGEVDIADNMKTEGTVIVTYADAKLIDWQIKVNGKAGTGIGHKSSVNTPNLLEARVGNGTQDLLVRAMFEIKNPAGMVLARVWSDPAFLPAGQNVVLEASWNSPSYPCIVYVTAYLYYGTQYPIIPGGFSQTLTLRVDTKPTS